MATPATTLPNPTAALHLPLNKSEPISSPPSQTTTAAATATVPITNPIPRPVPEFIDSITQLRNLSTALSSFYHHYDDLQSHLDSISSAIVSKLPPQPQSQTSIITTSSTAPLSLPSPVTPQPKVEVPIIPSSQPPNNATTTATTATEASSLTTTISGPPEKKKEGSKPSELDALCKTMCGKGLRRYILAHLSDSVTLKTDIPKSLKLAPNPAKLVLECSGRFFLQGSKAYTKNDSPINLSREASVLVLECFLLTGIEDEIDNAVKQEAEGAAIAWRKRLITEGGLGKANEIDARGLLLFIGGFGVPDAFKNEDFRDLVTRANPEKVSGALRKSTTLMMKIPGIMEWLLKNNMEVDAVDIAYTFGLEDRFAPQTILRSFLRECKESCKKTKKGSKGSLSVLNESNKKHLAALRSVVKCLERHKIDHSKLLPEWNLNDKIVNLEKKITELDKKLGGKTLQKRKLDEAESSKKLRTQQQKRSRFASDQVIQQRKAGGLIDSNRNWSDGGIASHINTYSVSPSMLHGHGTGFLAENIAGPGLGIGSGVPLSGVGGRIPADSAAILRADPYSGAQGDYSYVAGQMSNQNTQHYGWHDDVLLHERLDTSSLAGQPPSVGLTSLYRTSASLEGFAGLPHSSIGVSSRSSASDLYHFADAVVDNESRYASSSRGVGTVPSLAPTHRSSYLY